MKKFIKKLAMSSASLRLEDAAVERTYIVKYIIKYIFLSTTPSVTLREKLNKKTPADPDRCFCKLISYATTQLPQASQLSGLSSEQLMSSCFFS